MPGAAQVLGVPGVSCPRDHNGDLSLARQGWVYSVLHGAYLTSDFMNRAIHLRATRIIDVVVGGEYLIASDEMIKNLGALRQGKGVHAAKVIRGLAPERHHVELHRRAVIGVS